MVAQRGIRGYDAGKQIKGRKRHILVDTMGLLLAIVVHAASIQDRDGAKLVLEKAYPSFPCLKQIWADGGYAGGLIQWVKDTYDWMLAIVKRTDGFKGVSSPATSMGRRTNTGLVGPLSSAVQRLCMFAYK
jgi:putative transposase